MIDNRMCTCGHEARWHHDFIHPIGCNWTDGKHQCLCREFREMPTSPPPPLGPAPVDLPILADVTRLLQHLSDVVGDTASVGIEFYQPAPDALPEVRFVVNWYVEGFHHVRRISLDDVQYAKHIDMDMFADQARRQFQKRKED